MFARATIKYQGVYNAIIEIYPKFVLFGRMKKRWVSSLVAFIHVGLCATIDLLEAYEITHK